MASEEDPLVASKTFDDEANIHVNRQNPELTASRNFEPLTVRVKDVIRVYWTMGFIAFGGPSAHVAILRDHLVRVHEWLEEEIFMELFALGQGLPGPSSTQLLISTATTHGGALGGLVAFIMWCLPGFVVLTLCGSLLYSFIDPTHPPIWLLGVPPAAMALIFKASYGFVKTLDKFGLAIGIVACVVSVMINGDLRIPATSSQIVYPLLLVFGALATFIDYRRTNSFGTYIKVDHNADADAGAPSAADRKRTNKIGLSVGHGIFYFFIWLILLVGSIVLVNKGFDNVYLRLFEGFFRIGSLIFGGGIVMVPMAQSEFVTEKQWITDEQFFQGLGLAQSLPGPMFNFSAFLGATYAGPIGAVVAAAGLFGPGFILIFAMLPIWSRARHLLWFKAVLKGLNASAIGLIVSGCVFLYAKSVKTAADAMVFILTGGLAGFYNVQAPGVILSGVIFGTLLSTAFLNVGQKSY